MKYAFDRRGVSLITCSYCRIMGIMKSFVRNRSRPEGSIAEGYIALECLTFCSRYLHDIETKFTRHESVIVTEVTPRAADGLSIFQPVGAPIGRAIVRELSNTEWEQCHLYVLNQSEEVKPFIEYCIHLYCYVYSQTFNSITSNNRIGCLVHVRSEHKRQLLGARVSRRNIDVMHNRTFIPWLEGRV